MGLEQLCLAMVMYLEARGEGTEGMRSVGEVVIARTHDKRWPNNICGVVHQNKIKNGIKRCQFQSVCSTDFSVDNITTPIDMQAWNTSYNIAETLIESDTLSSNAKWFVASWFKQPSWTQKLCVAKEHGNHIFYEECS